MCFTTIDKRRALMSTTANILHEKTITVGAGEAARDIVVITRLGVTQDRPAPVAGHLAEPRASGMQAITRRA